MVKRNAQKARINDGPTTLALSILWEAKKDAEMWNDYVEEFGEDRANFDSLEVAHWVMHWINTHRKQAMDMGIEVDKFKKEKMK